MELLESGSVRPRQARYQAALRPDMKCAIHSSVLSSFLATPVGRPCHHCPKFSQAKGIWQGGEVRRLSASRTSHSPCYKNSIRSLTN